jgi:hypothetical protein
VRKNLHERTESLIKLYTEKVKSKVDHFNKFIEEKERIDENRTLIIDKRQSMFESAKKKKLSID